MYQLYIRSERQGLDVGGLGLKKSDSIIQDSPLLKNSEGDMNQGEKEAKHADKMSVNGEYNLEIE